MSKKKVIIKDMVMILGFPRSGTTWLSKILDSRPSTLILHEPDKHDNRNLILGNVPHFIKSTDWSKFAPKYREGIEEALYKTFPNLINFPCFKKEFVNLPYSIYFLTSCLYKLGILKNRLLVIKKNSEIELIWKSINQSCNIPFLFHTFPNLKIIYILRKPYSVIASMLKEGLHKGDYKIICERKYSSFFKKNNLDLEYVKRMSKLKKRALLWRINCESALIDGQKNSRFYWLLYENLCKNPIEEIKRLHKFLGWKFMKETKDFIDESRGKCSPSILNRITSLGYYSVYHGKNSTKYEKKLSKVEYNQIKNIVDESPLISLWSENQ